jgi:cardiolipin synthase (CMP-forming)
LRRSALQDETVTASTINVANFITMGRVIAVPVIFWLLLNGNSRLAFFVFLAAGISDAVDGFVAKRFNQKTELGAYLDPIADKLLIVSIYIALGVRAEIPLWLVIAVVSRDLLILGGVMIAWLMNHPIDIKPHAVSKLNTAAQITLAALVLCDEAFFLGLDTARLVMVVVTAALTAASFVIYMLEFLKHMNADTGASGGA